MLNDVERIDAGAMRRKLEAETGALLVCAHDPDEAHLLEGAITLDELERRREHLTHDQEIVFYCQDVADDASLRQARAWRAAGYDRAKILEGGLIAARAEGYRQVDEQQVDEQQVDEQQVDEQQVDEQRPGVLCQPRAGGGP